MTTKYPGDIDGYAEIRRVRDRIDEIVGQDHNDLRSAIIAIEQELGANPAGVFGTVVDRLDASASNIEAHVLGSIPRHLDTTIESNPKTGSPHFNLSTTTVGDQLQDLINFINRPRYSGSTPDAFADGYTLPASVLEGAITEIVRYLGGSSTGSGAVGFPGTSSSFADSSLLTSGSVKDGFDELVNKLGVAAGSERVGAGSFSSGRFNITGSSVDAQLQSLGGISEEIGSAIDAGFGGFVVSGMSVSRASSTSVNVAAGTISVGGRTVAYAGGSVTHGGVGQRRIQAKITSGVVVVQEVTTDVLLMADDSVPLAVFQETGTAHSGFVNLRRFGLAVNREFLTVGSSTEADFTSFKSALEWISRIQSAGVSGPTEIKVISDITVPSGEVPYYLPEGCSIDGGNHSISWSDDIPLFHALNVSNISMLNVRALFTSGVLGTAAALIMLETTSVSQNNFSIVSCQATSSVGDMLPYFLRYDTNSLGNVAFEDLCIQGCVGECAISGIQGSTSSGQLAPINARIIGNHFYQTTFAFQPDACIRAGRFSVVSSNIIEGGYNMGIDLHYPESILVEGNMINGGTGSLISGTGSAIMSRGINVRTGGAGWSAVCVIYNNYIKGIQDVGIDLRSIGSAAFCLVSNNFISNIREPTSSMIGIEARGNYTLTIENYIIYPGVTGIEKASQAIGNTIYGDTSITTTLSAINLDGGSNKTVIGNYIYNVSGIGIDCDGATNTVVSNNSITKGSATVSQAIYNAGNQSVISGNIIESYGNSLAVIQLASGSEDTSITGNILSSASGTAIECANCQRVMVCGNTIAGDGSTGGCGIKDFHESSIIANNLIYNMGDVVSSYGIISATSSGKSIVFGNLIGSGGTNLEAAIHMRDDMFQIVSDNLMMDIPKIGIDMSGGDWNMITGNFIDGTSTYVSGSHGIANIGDSSLIVGNYIRDANDNGIEIDGDGTSATGNYILRAEGNGVHINGDDAIVEGNCIENVTKGILANGSSCAQVMCNKISDTTEEGIYINMDASSVVGNHIKNAGSQGITANNNRCHIASNFIYSPAGVGVVAGLPAVDCHITGNFIDYPGTDCILVMAARCSTVGNMLRNCQNGVATSTGATNLLVVGNCVDTHSQEAYEVSVNHGVVIVGNRSRNTSGAEGYSFTSMTDSLLVGNYAELTGTSNKGFDISGTVTYVANLAVGGASISGFGAHNNAHNTKV